MSLESKNANLTTVEVSPGFAIEFAIEKCKTLSKTAALETLVGDYKFQAWEITKLPVSETFYYQVKPTPEDQNRKAKIIFECDRETESDIRDVTSKEWRNGKEYAAVNAWAELLIKEDQSLSTHSENRKKKTIIQINPKKDKNDPTDTSNYEMSQVNIAEVDGSGRIKQYQVQFSADTEQCARFFKVITQSEQFDPQKISTVDQMMMSFGVLDREVSAQELLTTIRFITGQNLPSVNKIESQKKEILEKARIAALTFYNEVQLGKSTSELKRLYTKLLTDTLPSEFLAELQAQAKYSSSSVSFAMETSCGLISFGEQSKKRSILGMMVAGVEKWTYTIGDCVRKECQKKNVEVGPCAICKDCEKVLDKKPAYPVAA